jgi:hypothetical protein
MTFDDLVALGELQAASEIKDVAAMMRSMPQLKQMLVRFAVNGDGKPLDPQEAGRAIGKMKMPEFNRLLERFGAAAKGIIPETNGSASSPT